MTTGFHPTDPVPRTQARVTDGKKLTREFEEFQLSGVNRYDWEFLAAIAIAKVLELETRLGADERRARTNLYPRRGNVIPIAARKEAGARADSPPPA
jgi:hypothetical protein